MQPFDVRVQDGGTGTGQAVVLPRGELDIATRDGLLSALTTAQEISADLCVDLADVDFVDASTLDVLVTVDRSCRRSGGRLRIRNASPHQRRLLRLCDLDRMLLPRA